MIDTFEVKTDAADWIFKPDRHVTSPTIFVSHLILNISERTDKDKVSNCEICIEKKIQNTNDFFSVCFKQEKIAKTVTEKTIEFALPIPLTKGDQLKVKFDNKGKGKAKLLVLWHR